MAKDPYTTLGVAKSASADEIKTAFRNLAKKYHPDKNKGDKAAEVKFKEINTANDILSDPAKRKKFDRGEIDAEGNERGFAGAGAGSSGPWGNAGAGAQGFRASSAGGSFNFSAEDIFADLFGSRGGGKQRSNGGSAGFGGFGGGAPKGDDIKYDLNITLVEAVRGGKRRIKLPHGKEIDVTVPPATNDGQTLRLKGVGAPGARGGLAGDALVTLRIEPHKLFTLKGQNLYIDIPVTLQEAVLGGTVNVPTLDGTVAIKVPKGSNTGTQMRLKGKGAVAKNGTAGDQYCTLKVMLPETPDDDLTNLVEKWAKKHPYDVRKKLF